VILKTVKNLLARANAEVLSNGSASSSLLGEFLTPALRRQCQHNPVLALQFLKLKRALPAFRSAVMKDAAIQDYLDRVTSPVPARPLPQILCESIRRSLNGVDLDIELRQADPIGAGACLGATRRAGGRSSLLRDDPAVGTFVRIYLERKASQWLAAPSLGLMSSANAAVTAVSRDIARRFKPHDIPSSTVEVVAERGAKLRIVTKNDPDLVALGHRYRSAMLPFLKDMKNVVVSDSLRDPELSAIHFPNAREGGLLIFSGDFSEATDRLSHEAMGFMCRVLKLDPRVVFEGHSVHGKPCTQGAFMGLPSTWSCMLTTLHYAVCLVVDPGHSFRIKGDDIIALWTREQIARFTDLASQIGLVVNNKTAKGPLYGTFCEGDYRLRWTARGAVLERLATFSLRSFLNDEPLAFDQWNLYIRRGVSQKRLAYMQRNFHVKWVAAASRLGVDRYAPAVLGGLGLVPPVRGKRLSLTSMKMLKAFHDGRMAIDLTREAFARGLTSSGQTTTAVDRLLKGIRYTCSGLHQPHLSRMVEVVASHCYRSATVADAITGHLRSSAKPSRYAVLKRQRRFIEVSLRGYSLPPSRETVERAYEICARQSPTLDSLTSTIDRRLASMFEGQEYELFRTLVTTFTGGYQTRLDDPASLPGALCARPGDAGNP
jgi:hypothetical protein